MFCCLGRDKEPAPEPFVGHWHGEDLRARHSVQLVVGESGAVSVSEKKPGWSFEDNSGQGSCWDEATGFDVSGCFGTTHVPIVRETPPTPKTVLLYNGVRLVKGLAVAVADEDEGEAPKPLAAPATSGPLAAASAKAAPI